MATSLSQAGGKVTIQGCESLNCGTSVYFLSHTMQTRSSTCASGTFVNRRGCVWDGLLGHMTSMTWRTWSNASQTGYDLALVDDEHYHKCTTHVALDQYRFVFYLLRKIKLDLKADVEIFRSGPPDGHPWSIRTKNEPICDRYKMSSKLRARGSTVYHRRWPMCADARCAAHTSQRLTVSQMPFDSFIWCDIIEMSS